MDKNENQAVTPKVSRVRERYSKRYPDRNFDGPEGLDALDELTAQELADYDAEKENANKLVDLFSADPRTAGLLNAMSRKENPLQYMIENFGDEFKDALETEEGKKMFLESHDKWMENMESDKKFEAEREKNFEESMDNLENFKNEKKLSDDQAAEVFAKVHQIAADVLEGKYTIDALNMAYKAMNYDTDVEDARTEGEVSGKNEKIEEKLRSSEKERKVLPPNLGGQGAPAIERKPKKRSNMFGI